MRAKFGINDVDTVGQIGKLCQTIEGASLRPRKVWDWSGMNCDLFGELPKVEVIGF